MASAIFYRSGSATHAHRSALVTEWWRDVFGSTFGK